MKLITFEIRMSHVNGPAHDWWQIGHERVSEANATYEAARLMANTRYRNVQVTDDPHDHHPPEAIVTSTSGLAQYCGVDGCTWSWDYD